MNEKESLTRGQWYALAAALLGWMFDGLEMGVTPIVARSALQDLLNVTDDGLIAYWNARMVACFMLGAAFGGVAFGWLGDKIGRVRAMIISILTYSLFIGLGYFTTAPWQFAVLLFISALGMGGQWSLGVALIMECWPERHRPKLAGVMGAASNVGILLIAAVAWCFPVTPDSWRWIMLVGASPALLALFVAFKVPESERWKAAKKLGGGSPLIAIFKPGMLHKTLLAIAFASIPLVGSWAAICGWIPLWADQLAGPSQPNAKAIVLVSISIGAIIACIATPFIAGNMKRRWLYFIICALAVSSCAYLFRTFTAYSMTFVFMTAIVGAVSGSFYCWLPLYFSELFPTRVRATGQGLSFNSGRILAAVGTIYMGQLVAQFDGSYSRAGATITLIYILGMILIWFAPETKGKPLPD
ncbi:MAG: MFS transporter [Thermoguttaceae bacterium]